jgi:hypothetical protein
MALPTSLPNLMTIYYAFQKLIDDDRQIHRQDGDLISLFQFLESRLKITFITTLHHVK